jgi:hypothetical protein
MVLHRTRFQKRLMMAEMSSVWEYRRQREEESDWVTGGLC